MIDSEQKMMPSQPQAEITSDTAVAAPQKQASEEQQKEPAKRSLFDRIFRPWRRAALTAMPAVVVNNMSNFLSASHVATEMAMFKSAMGDGEKFIKNPKNPINWVKEPFETVVLETFKKAKVHDAKEIFKGNVAKNLWDRVTNLESAVERFHARPENLGKNAKLRSPWQFRSTFAGLVLWSAMTVLPEVKESDDEVERMTIKRKVDPIGYVGERIKQALWFPEWHKHKTQLLGLGYAVIGTSSIIGAWRGRSTNALGKEIYVLNKGYLGTSLFTFASAFPALFATDEKNAYEGYGLLTMGRLFSLPKSISEKYYPKGGHSPDPGRHWYLGSTVSFQIENFLFALLGGAEKRKQADGTYTIVDHNELREQAREKAVEIRQQKKEAKSHKDEGTPPNAAGLPKVEDASKALAQPEAALPATMISSGTSLKRLAEAPVLQHEGA